MTSSPPRARRRARSCARRAIFDVYRGEQVGEGRKSVALSLVFQSAERTLSDEDAGRLRARSSTRSPNGSAPSFGAGKSDFDNRAVVCPECAPLSSSSPPSPRSRSAPARALKDDDPERHRRPGLHRSGSSTALVPPSRHLDPGSYTIKSRTAHPSTTSTSPGQGVDKATDVEAPSETGTLTWNVTFPDGTLPLPVRRPPNTMFGDFHRRLGAAAAHADDRAAAGSSRHTARRLGRPRQAHRRHPRRRKVAR